VKVPPLPTEAEVRAYYAEQYGAVPDKIDRVTYRRLAKELHESAKAAVVSAQAAPDIGSVDSLTPGLHVVDAGDHYLVIEVRTAAKENTDDAR